MNSLRLRLVAGIVAGMALVLAVGGGLAYAAIKSRLVAEFDRGLLERARSISAFVEVDEDGLQLEWLEKSGPHDPDELVRISNADGEILSMAGPAGTAAIVARPGHLDAPAIQPLHMPDGNAMRAINMHFRAGVDFTEVDHDHVPPEIDLLVARPDTIAPALASLRGLLWGIGAACLALSAVFVLVVVGHGLKPLASLRTQIGELGASSERKRVVLANPPAELAPVADELNRLLERLDSVLIRERNLTSNVAHELRTPIAGLLSTLEVALSRPRSADDYREAAEECLEIAQQMHWLVNNLLSITRIEAGKARLSQEIVDLGAALPDWWQPFAGRAKERGLQVDWQIVAGARLETDEEFLRVVLSNLYDNAVSYTPRNGTITVSADASGRIQVGNDAIEISAEVAESVFQPFWRGDKAREKVGVHVGLGLALCEKIVRILGGSIRAHSSPACDRFEVTMEFAV